MTEGIVERFFDRLMELSPVEATYHGLHEFDGRWPDGSLTGAQELRDLVAKLETELSGAEDRGLDLGLARYYAGLARFQLEDMRLWARMPEAPDQIGSGLFLLFARDFAPLEDRLESIATRLEGVPAFLAASRERLTEPVRLWCEVAATASHELPSLFATLAGAAPEEARVRRRLVEAAGPASQAAEDFARWLEEDVAPGASAEWPLGEAAFHRLLDLRQLPDPPDAILALGRTSLEEARDERSQLISSCWPGRTTEHVDALIRSQCPPSFEAALNDYREVIASAREFVAARGLATLPPDEELQVECTPAFLRPVLPFAAYEPPARFDARQLGIYVVTPRGGVHRNDDGGMSEHNRPAVLNTSVHEGYPGHHLQFVCAHSHPSLARLLSAECAHEMVEGWAHYCEQLMYEQGFTSGPEVRFVQLNDLIWRACRIIIDVELSCGRMNAAEATDMLVREAAMARPAAEAEVRRYTYTPGYQLSYLYGKHLILKLRQRRRRVEGAKFDLRGFHDRLLYAGALPAACWDGLF